jgi:NADP-dependent 3-hydroxy acid dehydrogenase YdfG
MSNCFLDQIAIVTGGSRGIGRATALALAQEGAHVTLAARTERELQATAQEVQALDREVLVVPTDVTQRDEVEQMVAKTLARWQRVDILVANAGAYVRSPVTELTVAAMERSMAVNFYGALHAVLSAQPHMLKQRSGHIVLVASMDAKKGLPLDAPYVAAKFALAGFGEVLRQELHGSGVSVSTIFPGRVDTTLIEDLKVPAISGKISPEDVATAIVHAIRRRRPEAILPLQARLLHYVNVLSPRLGDWITRQLHLEGWEKA